MQSIARHLPDDLAVSIITIDEVHSGWIGAGRKAKTPDQVGRAYDQLTEAIIEFSKWTILSFSAGAVRRYATIKSLKLNVGGNDSKIAAIALELGAVVVTRNVRDFGRVPGLATGDWSV